MATINLGRVRFNMRGNYNPDADPLYSPLDLVSDGGGSFVYINSTPSNEPTSSTLHWQQIAAQGEQGIQGPAGADGADAIASTTTGTLTSIGWAENSQTIAVTGATASNKLIITPDPSDFAEWVSCGVYASAQGVDQVTFTCASVPSSELTANVLILN